MWQRDEQVGNYIIIEELGTGGMGVVYKARDKRLGREVAIKSIRAQIANPVLEAAFLREARLASSLNHPGIVTIHDIFEHQGAMCIVMEYVDGKSLHGLIPSGGLPIEAALSLALGIGGGLAAAHAAGVVHRDLKPGNILVLPNGRIKILDFGLATVSEGSWSDGDTTIFGGSAAGTVAYMAPEQARGERVDHRADIFSFGVILSLILTGVEPFRGNNPAAILTAIQLKAPDPPSQMRPDLPAALDAVVLRALEKRREDRFPDMGELLSMLGQAGAVDAQTIPLNHAGSEEVTFVDRSSPLPPRIGSEKTSIGVTAFRSFSPDPDDQYVASGVASEIFSALNGVPGLRVAPQVASLGIDTAKVAPVDAARRLKVRYLVGGTLRRAGRRIRINAELVDANTGSVAWTRHYDREASEIFEVQEDISKSIVGSLSGHFIRSVSNTKWHSAPENLDAWGLLRKAYCIWTYEFSIPNLLESIDMLRRAVSLDPDYAAANAYLAHNLMQTAIFNVASDPAAALAEAVNLAERACAIAPEDPDTISCASSVFVNSGRAEMALHHLKRVLRVAPFDFVAWGFLGYSYAAAGGPAEVTNAAGILTQLIDDAPDHPSVPYWLMFLTIATLRLGQYDNAIQYGRRAVEMQPGYVFNEVLLGEALARTGREREAREVLGMIASYNKRFTMAMFDAVTLTACRSAETLERLSGFARKLGVVPEGEPRTLGGRIPEPGPSDEKQSGKALKGSAA